MADQESFLLRLVESSTKGVASATQNRHVVAAATAAAMRVALGAAEQDPELESRISAVAQATQCHAALNKLTKKPHHNLGEATKDAASQHIITSDQARALRGVRRRANNAKHRWSDNADRFGSSATTDTGSDSSQREKASSTPPVGCEQFCDIGVQSEQSVTKVQEQQIAWYPVLVPNGTLTEVQRAARAGVHQEPTQRTQRTQRA